MHPKNGVMTELCIWNKNMKNILTLSFLLLGLLSAISVNALSVGPEIPRYLDIADDYGRTYVVMGNSDCGSQSSTKYLLHPDHKKYNAIFSLLLAAQMSGSQVSLRYECTGSTAQANIVGVSLIK